MQCDFLCIKAGCCFLVRMCLAKNQPAVHRVLCFAVDAAWLAAFGHFLLV